MRASVLTALSLSLTLAAGTAVADPRDGETRVDYAEVIRVDPIIQTYERPVQRDQCWREPVTYRTAARRDRNDRAPAILGAIVGGVIGNQFGSGHGRDAATAAGALLGYHAVRDDQRYQDRYRGSREYTRYEERCAPRTEYFRDERVTGYDVTYRYRGEVYRTVLDYHPGDRMEVAVDVRPLR
ncbi:MAG: glycine zipper 2TM domain-containing protein [Xanthomonadales bacterium]|nr:glycine zipper 2TM domain-containing protein [Xanthomonadales bacterium]